MQTIFCQKNCLSFFVAGNFFLISQEFLIFIFYFRYIFCNIAARNVNFTYHKQVLNLKFKNMKRKSLFSSFVLFALSAITFGLFSCGTTEEGTIDIIFEPASLELKAGEKGTVKYNVTSTENLEKITITADGVGTVSTITSGFTTKTTHSSQVEVTATTAQIGKTFSFFVEVTDVKGGLKSRSFSVKVVDGTPPPPPPTNINTFTVVLMGAQDNTNGSFADLDAGKTYKIGESAANSAAIDLGYYYSTSAGTGAVLASPSSTYLPAVFTVMSTWGTKNDTKLFSVSATAADFAALGSTDGNKVTDFVSKGSAIGDKRVTGLSSDKVVGFETQAGKKGLLLVKSVQGTTDGTITIDVKILK